MLRELNIKNFAIIEDLHVEFTPGFNVLTGETGAGKSIIIDALELVLGGRGNRDFIKSGQESAFIQGYFTLPEDLRKRLIKEYGLWEDEGIIITRELHLEKPSVTRINGQLVSSRTLGEVTRQMIDVFAQNEGRDLISPGKQKELLDSFGDEGHHKKLSKMKELYGKIREVQEFLLKEDVDEGSRVRELDLLAFQLEEIESAALTEEDEEPLYEKYRMAKNFKEVSEAISEAYFELQGNEGQPGILENMGRALSALMKGEEYDTRLHAIRETLESFRYEMEDLTRELFKLKDQSPDEEELFFLEERMNLVHDLKRKYGNTIKDIEEFYFRSKERKVFLEDYEQRMIKKREELEDLQRKGWALASEIHESRRKIGDFLEKTLTEELRDLNIPDGQFFVRLDDRSLCEDGKDSVTFDIRTNLGQEPKPLAKIASGGEMSRIMLGFKSVIAQKDRMETLVFDEIDTGISGRTAQVVGRKIRELSRKRQTLVISHLPQIVAMADSHYYIHKEMKNGAVTSTIHKLSEEQRIIELARLISGSDITDMSMETAREMIESGKNQEELC